MKDSVFRNYDIRGIVGSEFTISKVYDLGLAIAVRLKELKPEATTCAIGFDGRKDSPQICAQLIQAMRDSGFDVTSIGLCPTPVLYFTLHKRFFDVGLMITGSHDPAKYNGVKICLNGQPVWGADLQRIKTYFHERKACKDAVPGALNELTTMIDEYVTWLAEHFADLKGYDGAFVVDCGNGTAGPVMESLIKAMDWRNVSLLFADVDGRFPHHEANPVEKKNMRFVKDALASGSQQFGIGFDGDGDRMAVMTHSGILIPGDVMLGLFATDIGTAPTKSTEERQQGSVVYDVKVSLALIRWISSLQLIGYFSPSGHSLIHTLMREKNAMLGGELNCHFFFADDYFGYDDGIYAMLRFIRLLRRSCKTADQLYQSFPLFYSTPEVRIPCSFEHKKCILKDVKTYFLQRDDCCEIMTLDGIRVSMPYGWALVRISNTQPVLSVRLESETIAGLQAIQRDIMLILNRFFSHEMLVKYFVAK